jgi:ribulose bisphosphate carboxylase small subunit
LYTPQANGQANGQTNRATTGNGAGSSHLPGEAQQTLKTLLSQGYRVGIEYVDERRFRTNSWQGYTIVQGAAAEAIATLQACFREHTQDYIRLVGIDANRRRVSETIVQRPGQSAARR